MPQMQRRFEFNFKIIDLNLKKLQKFRALLQETFVLKYLCP